MLDHATFTLQLGNWMDGMYKYKPPDVAHVSFNGSDDVERNDLIQRVNEWGLTSWEFKHNYRAYFANASSEGVEIIITAYPVIAAAIWSGSLEAIAKFLTSKLLDLFKSQWGGGDHTLENADEMA